MTPRQYKPIITKVLRESATKKFPNVEALADAIVGKMEQFEEMADLLIFPSGEVNPVPTIADIAAQNFEVASGRRVLLPGESSKDDISERVLPGKQVAEGLRENFTKGEIIQFLSERIPTELEVQPPGFAAPVKLIRRLQAAPGDLSFVKVLYIPAGSDSGVEIQVSTTEAKIDDVAVLEDIKSQAMAVLRPNKVTVQPRMVVPPPAALVPDPGFSSETDRETSSSDADQWAKWARKA